ncbi:MAG: ATP-binding cassette domain-containing protein [Deltaproteobacteria bacterium]|nr:ATP-binding cassette domain-containing protein [Deltaproteobacteria bacterium]
MSEGLIFAKELCKSFNGFKAVDGISLRMSSGECFGILGPNGAGKTTTVRMIYGFSPISSGTLNIFGMDIREHARLIKAKSGVCQQENNLDPDLTVFQNLVTFASYFDIPRATASQRASELLRFMGLAHKKHAKILELSGGMQRRLVIARALVNNPELLILDEPTTGLDPQSRHQVWGRLAELKAQGLGILLTTHYMEEAAQLCDRLVIMDHGRILVEGGPLDLIHQNVGANVIEVESPSESLLHFVKGSELDYEELYHRLLIYTKEGERLFGKISESFCDRGCSLRMATLEDVFLKLTGRELRD